MTLELNKEELELLLEVLEGRRQELHPEIRHCMDHTFKDTLQQKLKCCETLLARLQESGGSAG